MTSSPTESSEETSLLDNSTGSANGGGNLSRPLIGSYSSGGSGGAAAPSAESGAAAAGPPQTAAAAELEAARRAAVVAQVNQVMAPDKVDVPLTGRRLLVRSLVNVSAYLSAGVAMYHWLAGMKFLDALYFCVVTLTTVGYGDLSAHKPETKLFACAYILVGVALVASFLAQLVELLLDEQEDLLMKLLRKSRAQAVGFDAASEAEKVGVAMGIFYFLLLVGGGTAVFKMSGDMSVIDALYLTVVSSSTVGYGDYFPATAGTRLFAIFFLPLSTLLLGKVISDYTEMKASERTKRKQTRILLATVTGDEYQMMDSDKDGRVSPLEFLCRTLIKQEKVTQEDITAVHNRFLALDRDNNGFVTRDEIGRDRDRDGDGFINPHEL